MQRHFLAVCAPKGGDIARLVPPFLLQSEFAVVSDNADDFDAENVTAVLWCPPTSAATVQTLFERVRRARNGTPPRWFHSFFAGVDALHDFLPHLDAERTVTTNGRGAFSESLAEYSLAAMLHFNKQIPLLQQNQLAGKWDKFKMNTLAGKTVGFLGWGSIAKATAKICTPLGMKCVAFRRRKMSAVEDAQDAEVHFVYEDVGSSFCASCDFVVSTLPSTPETKDFCNREFFAHMKPSAVFINVGRGATVNEDDLRQALDSRVIAGAALDVFKTEPLPADSPLWHTRSLLISSHNADNTTDYIELGWKVWVQNFDFFCNDFNVPPGSKTLPTYFDPKVGY